MYRAVRRHRIGTGTPPAGRLAYQFFPHGAGQQAQRMARVGRGAASEGTEIVRRALRVTHDQAYRGRGGTQLGRDEPGQRGPVALATVDLAGEPGDPPVSIDGQVGTAEIWQAVAPAPLSNVKITATRSSGTYIGSMVIGGWGTQPPAIAAAMKEQQRVDLERSLDYAKRVLGVGVRWKS